MKRKFIFLAMLLLTLVGGVKWNVLNAQEGQYRIKSNSTGKYLTIFNYTNSNNSGSQGGVGLADYAEDNDQIFTFEVNNSGHYVKSADGYYIKCYDWNVDAYSTSSPMFNATTLLGFDFGGGTFKLRKLGSSKYFKVEYVSNNYYVFCDCDGTNGTIENWVLEAVVNEDDVTPGAPTDLNATEVTHNYVTLSWTAGTDALYYNVYRDGSKIADKISGTTYKDETVQAETTYKYTVESVRFNDNVSTTHSNEVSVTTLEIPAIQEIIVGDGVGTSKYVPVHTYYNYSYSQQIFTKSQLDFEAGNISKIAFFKTDSGYNHNRKLKIYMVNTDKESFSGTADWVAVAESDLVYDSGESGYTFSANNDWCEIQLNNVFEYQGGNILIYIQDNTGSYKSAPTFKTNDATGSAIMVYSDGQLLQDNNLPKTSGTADGNTIYPRTDTNNQIKFTWEAAGPSVDVNHSEIAFGHVRLGNYWSEKNNIAVTVTIEAKNTEITNISKDNDFFIMPDFNLPATNIEFELICDVANGEAKEYTADLTIEYGDNEDKVVIPVTATAYNATEGDAIENPFEVNFTEDSYSNTVNFTTLHDDYTINGEAGPTWQEGNNPDAVYKFTLTENALVTTNVSANHWMAIYNADFNGQGGPKADNHIYTWLNNQMLNAGTYYVVIAANEAFTFTLTKTAIPAPIVTYYNPYNNAVNQVNPMLEWGMEYAEEYQLLLGTAKDAMEVVVNWTTDLATSYQTVDLQNNTQYFWQVNAKGEGGETTGEVYSFVTLLNVPAEVTANATNLYPGESTTISWTEVEGASEYNIYVDGNKVATTAETSYELSGLAYNMTGYNVTVSATHALGESLQSEGVVVKVAGEFPLVVSVKDSNGNPIEGATVTVDMTKAYDEFKNQVAAVEAMTTNAEGTATVTLPLIGGYDSYGTSWFTPYYLINISKYPYGDASAYIYNNSISNNTQYTSEKTLYLPTISWISFEDQVVTVDSDIVLTWSNSGVEEATAYNVYKKPYGGVETLIKTVTTNELTITAEHDNIGSKYGVSAVFGDIETSITYTSSSVYVLGNGSFSGYVTDGTNPIANLTFELAGTNAIGEDISILTTDENGYFKGEILEGNDYTLTISHYDYEEFVMPVEIVYDEEYDFGTIVLTAKPSVEDIAVTATDNGEYANVTWTGSYEKYNVYRRNIEDPQEVELLGEVTASPYTDNEWAELEDGTYQYGVSTFVEEQAQSRGSEVILEANFDDGVIPSGWNATSIGGWNGDWTWSVTSSGEAKSPYNNDGLDATIYLITPLIKTSNSTLEFDYMAPYYNGTDRSDFYVRYSTNPNGPWKDDYLYYSKFSNSYVHITIDLSVIEEEQVYIAFCNTNVNWGGNGIYLDNIVVTSESSAVESQIVWSNEITKQGPATFEGTVSTDWNTAANWNTNEVPAAGADVIINASAVISSEVNVKNIEVNAELTIDNGGILNVTNNFEQASYYNVVLVEGGQIFQKNEGITARFKMDIENPSNWETAKDGWQFISMPMTDVYYSDFTSLGEHDLYKYDGSKENEWLNYKEGNDFEEGSFKSGYGYLATLKDVTTATVYGTLNVANPFAIRQFSWKENGELANLHLIGNPFTYNLNWDDVEQYSMVTGYAYVKANGDYEYKIDGEIKVGEGFFIQTSGTYASLAIQTRSSKEKANSINIIASGKAGKDNVIVNFAGKAEGFNKLQNFNDAIATVYVSENGKHYGIANVDENTTEVALNFNAKEMGNYSISLDVNGKFEAVTLVDRFTGIETNMLLEDEYTFTSTSNDNPNRFVIRLDNGQQTTDNGQFVYQSGEELILSIEGHVQIVDMLGRVVYSNEHANGDNRISVSEFNNAAYVVRVINEEGVKTQKVVIY